MIHSSVVHPTGCREGMPCSWTRTDMRGGPMKCNKAKFKVLHLDWNNHKHKYRVGNEWIESNSVEKDLRVPVN